MTTSNLKKEIYDLVLEWDNFNLQYTLENGQCFRWNKVETVNNLEEMEYIGVALGRVIKIRQKANHLYISSDKKENLQLLIEQYFDSNTDYKSIEETISKIDTNISTAVNNSSGLRILNQDPFETLISYIISANNNIPRISKSINEISKMFGKKLIFENNEYYAFPTLEELSYASEPELRNCGVGFRAKYIISAIEQLYSMDNGLEQLHNLDNESLKNLLITFKGVGPKVSDCIMLFAYGRKSVFPVDVWVKKVMEKLYFRKNTKLSEIWDYSNNNFGEYAGIIQQHLFYNIREGWM